MIVPNAMTVDVEDYFQVQAFAPYVDRANWDSFPRRVEANADRVLDSLLSGKEQGILAVSALFRQNPS